MKVKPLGCVTLLTNTDGMNTGPEVSSQDGHEVQHPIADCHVLASESIQKT